MIPLILGVAVLLGLNQDASSLKRIDTLSIGPKVDAKSVMVLSHEGQVLWSKNPFEKRSIASLTKLMTALVVLDQKPQWDKKIRVSENASKEDPVKIKLKTGDEVSLLDLWYASLVGSANDATVALVEGVSLSEEMAVELMNRKVEDFNLVATDFVDTTGLSSKNISNAEDTLIIFRRALDRDMIRKALSTKSYNISISGKKFARVRNTNKLLGIFPRVAGGKTGYIEESGYNLALSAKGKQSWGASAVILGSSSDSQRFKDMRSVLAWTFSHYIMKK